MGRLFIYGKDGKLLGIIDDDLGLEWLSDQMLKAESRPKSPQADDDACSDDEAVDVDETSKRDDSS